MDRAARDRRLLEIRRAIETQRGAENFDFYDEDFVRKWRMGNHDPFADETITQADIRLLVSARRHARYADLEPAELAGYRSRKEA